MHCLQPYQNLFDMNSAFYAGTIFKDLYSPYCAIKYSKEEKTTKNEHLNAIRKITIFAVDLNLYLDNFPNCKRCN